MQKIGINTSHNIVIDFGLASTGSRIGATALDFMILSVYATAVSSVFYSVPTILVLLLLPVYLFYHLAFEILNDGQSPGKKMCNIRVTSVKGSSPSLKAYLMRWVFRLLDLTGTAGLCGLFFISSTQNRQRVGDIIAQTVVVNTKQSSGVNIDSLLKLGEIDREISYPGVIRYTDTDMLLVKDTINRAKSTPNLETRKILVKLANKIAHELGVKLEGISHGKFLVQVLEEYIILTR